MTGFPVVVCLVLQMMMSHQVVRVDGAWDGGTMFGMGMTSTHFQQPHQLKLTTMSQGKFLILAALLVGSNAYSINPALLYGFPGAYNPYGPGKKGYEEPAPLRLTCSAVFTVEDPKLGRLVEAIAANFKDKSALNIGAGYPYSPLYTGLGAAFGQNPFGGAAGISADIEVYTSLGGKPLTLMLTERGYSGGGCVADNFGESLIPGNDKRVTPAGYSSFFAGGLGLGAGAGAGAGMEPLGMEPLGMEPLGMEPPGTALRSSAALTRKGWLRPSGTNSWSSGRTKCQPRNPESH
ncbi:uncharacterized protein LOC112574593 isoform X2 [Pomacea canaliculata]|uniref:uncharacterized protein LOC112574593 isoform X2 n=1 Tax=Pomacea canaliculata TaxID=400727 RepID=UPI000D73CFB7|nr:uncharacterized protein LOC112574593 isoform X2 [Pomacea canaliculata]